jgi:hypothetical protein
MPVEPTPEQTSEPTPEPALTRHIVPVLVGGMVTLLLTVVTDNALSGHQVLPGRGVPVFNTSTLLLMLGYRGLFAILGCHLAARVAPADQPRMRYALGLGFLMLALNVVGAVSLAGQVPTWYSLCSIALTIPYAIIGGGTATRAMAGQTQRRTEK